MNDYILQVNHLKTYFKMDTGTLKAVDDVTFHLKRNETIGIIGESGCGKSVTAHSILRTVQNPGKVLGGEILYDDGNGPVDLVKYGPDSKEMRRLRGKDISMVFQEPMASLSPVYTIGAQMMEAVMVHQEKKDKKSAFAAVIYLLSSLPFFPLFHFLQSVKSPPFWHSSLHDELRSLLPEQSELLHSYGICSPAFL